MISRIVTNSASLPAVPLIVYTNEYDLSSVVSTSETIAESLKITNEISSVRSSSWSSSAETSPNGYNSLLTKIDLFEVNPENIGAV